MGIKLSNNAATILAATVGISDTSVSVSPGAGAMFPSLSAGEWFPATLIKATGEFEIVKVTGRSSDVLTVERAQENTMPKSFQAGDRIELRITAGTVQALLSEKLSTGGGSISGDLAVSGSLSAGSMSAPTASFASLNGGTPWTSANLTLSSLMPKAGGAFTGKVSTAPINSPMAQNDVTSSIEVINSGSTGDANLAMMSFHAQGAYAIKMGVRADGYFGLGGWSRPAWSWYSAPTGDMVAAGNVAAYSDPRLKDNITVIEGALAIIQQLRGVRFTWNGKTKLIGKPGQRDIGVLADEVEAVLPELVSKSVPDDENDGQQWSVVAYDKLVPVLIEAVKELSVEVRTMKRGM